MAVTALTAFLPSVVSKSIFAPRRADKSLEANNTPATILNAGIAAMQLTKLGDGIVAIRNENKAAKAVTNNVSNLASKGSIFSDISKATNQITKHVGINGWIGLAALSNVLMAPDDKKESALVSNAGIYGGMLATEGAHKIIFGTVDISGDKINKKEGLYRKYEFLSKPVDKMKVFCEKQEEALKDSGDVKRFVGKMMKYAPGGLKGLSFAAASIGGSALGYYTFNKAYELAGGKQVS